MEQRDEIVKKLKRRYGVDPTQPGSMLKMPDPSLPPEQQMEMMQGNSGLVSPVAGMDSMPVTNTLLGTISKAGLNSSPGMQKDFSIFSLASKTTNDTKFTSEHGEHSLVMSPSIKFGLYKNKHRGSKPSLGKNPFSQRNLDMTSPRGSV